MRGSPVDYIQARQRDAWECALACALIALAGASGTVAAQQPPPRNAADSSPAVSAVVSGIVYDSIAGRPIPGVRVEFVNANDPAGGRIFSAVSDSSGRYTVRDLLPGRYIAGFFHVGLDTLGFDNPPKLVTLTTAAHRVDLATPSVKTLMSVLCPARDPNDSSGLLVGHIRDTETRTPIARATVLVEWREVELDALGIRHRDRDVTARSGENGWFGVCGLPGDAALQVRAVHGQDSSGYVEVELPPSSLRHVGFHVGGAALVPVPAQDSTAGGTSAPPMAWRGGGRLSGTVRDPRGQPIAGAHALVWGSSLTATTSDRGTFSLENLPGGTQTLEVSVIGFVPARTIVHLAESRPATVDVSLVKAPTMLEAMTIRDQATYSRQLVEFERRRRAGVGTFLTSAAMENQRHQRLSDVLRRVPGVILEDFKGRTQVLMRGSGTLADPMFCTPTLYIDRARDISGDFDLLRVDDIAAIEVYPRPAERPFEFVDQRNACGAIVVWTRLRPATPKRE